MSLNESISHAVTLPDILVGALYLVAPLGVFIIYIPCIVVLMTDHEVKNLSCLRIMAHMGLTDLLQLLGFMLCGVWQITGLGWKLPYWVNRIATTYTIMTGWWNYIFLANLLGLNRMFARVYPAIEERVFSHRATTVWLTLVWVHTGLWMALYATPYAGMLFYPAIFCFYFDTSLVTWRETMNGWGCILHTALTTVWYIVIGVSTVLELNGLSSISEDLRRRERSLLIQSVMICLVLAVADQYFHNCMALAYVVLGRYTYVLSNFLFICMSCCNPFIYLTFNKTLRNKVKQLLGLGVTSVEVVTVELKHRPKADKSLNDQLVVQDL